MVRLQVLQARLAAVDRRLAAGTVSVVRGGRALLAKRGRLAAAQMTGAQWRGQWESARLFLTADGEKDTACGNQTIRWHPGEGGPPGQEGRPPAPRLRPGHLILVLMAHDGIRATSPAARVAASRRFAALAIQAFQASPPSAAASGLTR